MEQLKYKLLSQDGKESGSVQLSAGVFDADSVPWIVHQTVRWQRAKARSGTHRAATKAEVSGGGKKPWKQKGTGNARAGSNTSPLWVGGGKSHGPRPRSYGFRLPKRARRQALAAALSEKRRDGSLLIVDKFEVKQGKSAEVAKVFKALGIKGKRVTMVVSGNPTDNAEQLVLRGARNIEGFKPLEVGGVNVYDVLNAQVLLTTRRELEALQGRLEKN